MWNKERLGLIMIMASLLVMGVVVFLSLEYQLKSRLSQVRSQGVGLTRVLSGMAWEDLVPEAGRQGVLHTLRQSQSNPYFAYAAVVDSQGRPRSEIALPGVIIPNQPLSDEPAGWLGQRELAGQGKGGFLEFYAPLLAAGVLQGHIRLGYVRPEWGLRFEELPYFATLALPVFLLTPLFYFLLYREIRPLRKINENLSEMLDGQGVQVVELKPSGELGMFMERFMQFAGEAKKRIHHLEDEQQHLVMTSKLLSYKNSRIETILQTLPDAVMVFDEAGMVSYSNDKITGLLGLNPTELIGKKPPEWCVDTKVISYLSRHGGKGGQVGYISDSIKIESPLDQNRLIEIKAYPLFSPKDGANLLGKLVVIRDCTEEQLAYRSRGEFVAQVAHELKTPLNVLAMYSESLMGESGNDEHFRVEAVNVIHDEVERLSTLINNMLAITKFELGGMQLKRQRVRLHELLEDAFNNIAQSGRGRELAFEVDLPREMSAVYVDKDLLRIAINNLLTNAIKYNRPGGEVRLSAQETDEWVEIRVKDTGLGISAVDQERIFDKFFRSEDERVRQQTGHGLGLSLAQQIVQLHHGSLSLESEYGKGSEFIIRLEKEVGVFTQAGAA